MTGPSQPCTNRRAPATPCCTADSPLANSAAIASSSPTSRPAYTLARSASIARGGNEAICSASRVAAASACPGRPLDPPNPCPALPCPHLPAGEDQIQCPPEPHDPGQTYGPTIDQRHADPAAEHAQDGVGCRQAQISPARQFQPAGHGMALDGSNHRFGKRHP